MICASCVYGGLGYLNELSIRRELEKMGKYDIYKLGEFRGKNISET